MSQIIEVNIVALADEIATRIMDERYTTKGESWTEKNEYGIYVCKTEEIQDEFDDLYDEAEEIIRRSKV